MKNIKEYIIVFSTLVLLLVILRWISGSRYNSIVPSGFNGKHLYHAYEGFDDNVPVPQYKYNDASAYVQIFSEEGNTGNTLKFTKNNTDISKSTFTGSIKSFTLGPFTKLTFYENAELRGRSVTYVNKQDFDLPVQMFKPEHNFMIGKVQSLTISLISPYIIAYTGQNLGGAKSKVFGVSTPTLQTDWNGNIVSFILSPFSRVVVYDSPGYKGNSQEYTNTSSDILKINYTGKWATIIKSLKIEGLGEANF